MFLPQQDQTDPDQLKQKHTDYWRDAKGWFLQTIQY